MSKFYLSFLVLVCVMGCSGISPSSSSNNNNSNSSSQELIEKNKRNNLHLSNFSFKTDTEGERKQHQTRRVAKKERELFGGKLYLRIGKVSDLYRDILDLYQFYIQRKNELSSTFPSLIRMSLRLLCETAAKDDNNRKFENYLKEHFENARKNLDQDIKTTLSNLNVNEKSIIQLLHTGAHDYQSASNLEQTIAMSIIIGAILTITHGREE
jgi:hypothetical protein